MVINKMLLITLLLIRQPTLYAKSADFWQIKQYDKGDLFSFHYSALLKIISCIVSLSKYRAKDNNK